LAAAAPEYVSKLEVGEATDVWAYGAVLLVAATWLVLGQKGMLEFEMFRTLSLSKLRSAKSTDTSTRVPLADNSFHDGTKLLDGIYDWTRYLKEHMRISDHITGSVIDIILNRLLVDEKHRISSRALQTELQRILEKARTGPKKPSEESRNTTMAQAILAVEDSLKDRMSSFEALSRAASVALSHNRSSRIRSSERWNLPKEASSGIEKPNEYHLAHGRKRPTPASQTDSHRHGSPTTSRDVQSKHSTYSPLPSENHHLLNSGTDILLSVPIIPECK
jgi:hypothetical protein